MIFTNITDLVINFINFSRWTLQTFDVHSGFILFNSRITLKSFYGNQIEFFQKNCMITPSVGDLKYKYIFFI